MKNKKILWILAVFVVALVVCVLLADPVYADVGNSFSGGSGGSSSSSGGGYSGGSGISISGLYFLSDNPYVLLLVIAVIIYQVYKNRNQTKVYHGGGNANNVNHQPPQEVNEEKAIAQIIQNDEHFSSENFKNYAKEVWLNVQEAWEEKDWHRVRPFESNTLFNVHSRQLQEYIDQHKTNYLNMQNIRNVTIANYQVKEDFEVVHVKLDASLLDFVLDDETNQLLEGSRTNYAHRSYDLEFIRKKGVKTTQQEGTAVTNCPNCGAPTTVTSSGQCEYCKSIITNGDFGWVLNSYGPWH